MRMPWTRRADQEKEARQEAEQRLDDVKADWPKIHAEVAVTRREVELNGWTRAVTVIFSGH